MKCLTFSNIKLQGVLWLLAVIGFSACEKPPSIPISSAPSDTLSKGMLIGSEGNFQWGNATLGFYDPNTKTIYENVFETINEKKVGDVLQSLAMDSQYLYLTINNSGKIWVCNRNTFKVVNEIKGLRSPRHLCLVGNGLAYASDLYDNRIAVINLNTFTVTGYIPCKGWTEEMLFVAPSSVWVTNKYSEYVYIVSTVSHSITDSIKVSYGSNSLCKDKLGRIWITCTGKKEEPNQQAAALYCLQTNTPGIVASFQLTQNTVEPTKIIATENGNDIIWLQGNLYKMDVSQSSLPRAPWYAANGRTLYGLGYDPNRNEVYVSDAKDYVQKSDVLRLDDGANLIHSFRCGINTGAFLFK